jgi:DNA-binding transcriptional ArsR family regulator
MLDEDDRRRVLLLLEAVGMTHASEVSLDVGELSRDLDLPEQTIRMDLDQLEALGLILTGFEEGLPVASSWRAAAKSSTKCSASCRP